MKTRQIGPLTVSAVGLGCMGLSQGYGAVSDDQAAAAIYTALDAGITLFDTAMSYGEGANEGLLGRALLQAGSAGRHAQIATKVGIARRRDGVGLDADPNRIRQYAVASLNRLGREVIDLYYLHRVDPRFPLEDQVGALADLVDEGLVRAVGLSEVTPEQLSVAASVADIAAVQLEWSLAWRAPERDVVAAARDHGVALVPYSPVGRGLLADSDESADPATSPFRRGDPRFDAAHRQPNRSAARRFGELARRRGMTASQLAIAWLLHAGTDVVPIPGSRASEHIRENAAATTMSLDVDLLARLDALSGEFVGDRHSFAVPVTERAERART